MAALCGDIGSCFGLGPRLPVAGAGSGGWHIRELPVHGTHTTVTGEAETPVKAITRRLRRLEQDQFGRAAPEPERLVISTPVWPLNLPESTCLRQATLPSYTATMHHSSGRFPIILALCAVTVIRAPAQTFTNLTTFSFGTGIGPSISVAQGLDGNLYGTTVAAGKPSGAGNGTFFKITPSGTFTKLLLFTTQNRCQNNPTGPVPATNGLFYGGTDGSGTTTGYGTIFQVTPSGKLTTLHTFDNTDGDCPLPALVEAINGIFYGTTFIGGTYDGGTIFQITLAGTFKSLYSFTGGIDGFEPDGLVQGADGNLYGTAQFGGADGLGAFFKISLGGAFTSLYSFGSATFDGVFPNPGIIEARDGNFYGTTAEGGVNSPWGTIFKVTSTGTESVLYNFCNLTSCADGSSPAGGLVEATDGNFYGTTLTGGANGKGTIFQITPTGQLSTLYNFCSQPNCPDGYEPLTTLLQATDGNFYGTTHGGNGTVFKLSTGLAPFVKPLPISGKVGSAVKILGSNLTGATSVTFNGAAATFTVVSNTEISTTVPTGATTGKVQVDTPNGTLSSNGPFRVLP